MKLKFLGATGTVTGSKYLIEHNSKKILIDCGLFQGPKRLRLRNWEDLPININTIDSVILTHAHIDHSGYIPRLVKSGFRGKIYCTPPTRDLCKILLPDCGYLQEEEARYANKRRYSKHKPALPLFTFEEARTSLEYFRPVEYKKKFELGDGLSFEFRNAGHILGSASVTISDGAKSITFSGDIGREEDPVLYPSEVPDKSDYIVMESTYGNRMHSKSEAIDELEGVINETYNRGGVIIVPAFAVGRSQMLLRYISVLLKEKRIPNLPIYLNSPMATNVTDVYCDHRNNHKLNPDECAEMCNIATYVNTADESKRLNLRKEPMLIISASGMATGGRVIHHIKAFGSGAKNTLLFTGFQAGGTRGEKIVSGAETVRIHGQDISIRAQVVNLNSLSAHADQSELLRWAKKFSNKPTKVFVTHGEANSSSEFKKKLEEDLGWDVVMPEYLDEVEL